MKSNKTARLMFTVFAVLTVFTLLLSACAPSQGLEGGGGQGGEDAQASSAQPPDLLPLPNHERHDRGLQQRHPGPEVRGEGLPLLRQLPNSHPVLLRQARSQAAATLPLKYRKNRRMRSRGAMFEKAYRCLKAANLKAHYPEEFGAMGAAWRR